MADISFLSIKIFVEVSKIWKKNRKRELYIVLKVFQMRKEKIYCHFSLMGISSVFNTEQKLTEIFNPKHDWA
jgi:hypothetical protein